MFYSPEKLLADSTLFFKGNFSDTAVNQSFISQTSKDGNYMGYLIFKTDSTATFLYYRDRWTDSGGQMTFKKNIGYIESHSSWGFGEKIVRYELK